VTSRRCFLAGLGTLALTSVAGSAAEAASILKPAAAHRRLRLKHLHTGERIDVVYQRNGRYLSDGLAALNRFLRDHRDQSVHAIDTRVLDFLHDLTGELGTRERIGIVCGYRSPRSNAFLRANSSGVAKRSLHLEGMAIDIRVPGMRVSTVAEAALDLKRGGVGRYTRSNFVHIDCGKFRTWGS
jgi:uncharacterized protein YcbK (DUF882 family)